MIASLNNDETSRSYARTRRPLRTRAREPGELEQRQSQQRSKAKSEIAAFNRTKIRRHAGGASSAVGGWTLRGRGGGGRGGSSAAGSGTESEDDAGSVSPKRSPTRSDRSRSPGAGDAAPS